MDPRPDDQVPLPTPPMLPYRGQGDLIRFLRLYDVDAIFDIGANVGNSGTRFRQMGFEGPIVSFEPVASLYAQLSDRARHDELWRTVQVGLGTEHGTAEIQLSGVRHTASSLLPMTPALADYFAAYDPQHGPAGVETIALCRLETFIASHYPLGDRLFLKLDVQGYEKQVLAGAGDGLQRVVGLKLEMSVVPLYEGEVPYAQTIAELAARGFALCGFENGHTDPGTGVLCQVDGIFFRTACAVTVASPSR